jgi:hypothetical protein
MGWAAYAALGLMAGFLPRLVLGQGPDDVGLLLGLGQGALGGELGDRVRNLVFWAGLLVLVGLLGASLSVSQPGASDEADLTSVFPA